MADREKRSATIAIRRGSRKGGAETGAEESSSIATGEAETVPRNPTVQETQIPQQATSTSVAYPTGVGRIVEELAGEKLASSPLSVLLPKLDDVSALHFHRSALEDRLEALTETQGGQQSSEVAMLKQVLSWLSLDGGEGA